MTITLDRLRELKALVGEMSEKPWQGHMHWGGAVTAKERTAFDCCLPEDARALVALRNSAEELIDFAVEAWDRIKELAAELEQEKRNRIMLSKLAPENRALTARVAELEVSIRMTARKTGWVFNVSEDPIDALAAMGARIAASIHQGDPPPSMIWMDKLKAEFLATLRPAALLGEQK